MALLKNGLMSFIVLMTVQFIQTIKMQILISEKSKDTIRKKWNTSLDSPKPSAYDVKKGKFVEQSVVMPASYETPEQELLNDCLEKLSDDEASFLRRVVKRGEATKLAEEYHVSNKTINAWKNKLINKIKNF